MIAFVARNTAPPGWLKANGAAVSRTTYSALFGAIGTTFGVGNGSTTFNVPDLRGEFPRGWDDGRGIDSGRAIGSAQGHMFETHIHQLTGYAPTGSFAQTGASLALSNTGNFNTSAPQSGNFGAETRPRNIALLAIIKF
jgi:microcystin-dependent protein